MLDNDQNSVLIAGTKIPCDGHFKCYGNRFDSRGEKDYVWKGEWHLVRCIKSYKGLFELDIAGTGGRIRTILGTFRNREWFLAIPDIDVGVMLSPNFGDTYWNYERLQKHLYQGDAITVANALEDFAQKAGLPT